MLNGDTDLDSLRKEANALQDAGKLEDALSKWKQLRVLQDSPYAASEYAGIARDLKLWEEAEKAHLVATEMAAAKGGSLEAILYVQWALTLMDRHKEEGGQEHLERCRTYLFKAIAIKEQFFYYTALGASYLRTGEDALAEQYLRRALQLNPNDEEALYNLAEVKKNRAPEEAAELYKKSLAIDPEYAIAYRGLAEVYLNTDRFEEAEHLLRRSLRLDASNADCWLAHTLLGELLERKRKVKAAGAAFERGAELGKREFRAQEALAWFYEGHGTLKQAAHAYRKCLELAPEDARANRRYGIVLFCMGKAAKAKAFLKRSLEMEPDNKLSRKYLDKVMKMYPHRGVRRGGLRKRRTGYGR
jgi:tetratricopeptide (TPR) repeat protein